MFMTYQVIWLSTFIRPPFLRASWKIHINWKEAKNALIKGVDDKRHITATFTVSATGNLLPTQLIYSVKTRRCLSNVEIPRSFHVTYTENHWSNQLKATEHFEKVIFPALDQIKENMAYPKEQMSLVIMDTFKKQDNNLRELCAKKQLWECDHAPLIN